MKFRKKPVTVEARRLTHANAPEVAAWCGSFATQARFVAPGEQIDTPDAFRGITIHTLEGDMRAAPGDWIIRGVNGEFYPCKPGIFEATYEPVEDDAEHPPKGGHVLTATHDYDMVRYRIECHEPDDADCRIYCPDDGCESWHIKRDDTGPYHVTDGGVRHDLVPHGGGCSARDYWENEPSPEFVWCRAPYVIGRVPVTPVWVNEGVEWHIPDPD